MDERLYCEVCKTLINVESCNFCIYSFCPKCMIQENHNNGDFKCTICNKYVCNSFRNEIKLDACICFYCSIKGMVDEFGDKKDIMLKGLDKILATESEEKRDDLIEELRSELIIETIKDVIKNLIKDKKEVTKNTDIENSNN